MSRGGWSFRNRKSPLLKSRTAKSHSDSDTHLASTCTCFLLDNGHVLTALCLTDTGKLAPSQIDLDLHLGNDKGKFKADGRDFSQTAMDVRLDGLTLRASLKHKDKWVDASYNLNSCVENIDGELHFHRQYVEQGINQAHPYIFSSDGFWNRDGAFATFLENLPVVGYAVAGLDLLHGDEVSLTSISPYLALTISTTGRGQTCCC